MTPVLVVDNTGRLVCRGQIQTNGARAIAHLHFAELLEPRQPAARLEVADIKRQTQLRMDALARVRRRQVLAARALRVAGVVGGLFVAITTAWFLLFGLVWAIAAVFGFEL